MKYVVLKDYVDPAGKLIKTAEIVELPDDKFTGGLVQHDFIVKAKLYDELKALATKLEADLRDAFEKMAEAFGLTEDGGK